MRISSAFGLVDFGSVGNNEGLEKKASAAPVKNMQAGTSIVHMGAAVQSPESAVVENGSKGIFGIAQTLFTVLNKAVNFFKGLFPNIPLPVPPWLVGPAPFNPAPVNPTPVNPFPYSPSPASGKKPDDIWGGFAQGPDGNCVTVAGIKAAMMKFGQKPTDIFTEVKKINNGYEVVMRDGFKLQLSESELQLASSRAQFRGSNREMFDDANFLFAASAKRAQMENNDGTANRSFSWAIYTLNDGEHSREGLLRLGLKDHIRTVPLEFLQNGMIGTVERGGHSVAVINGREELWGRPGGAPTWGFVTGLV
ncbi:hypothetical protein ABH905_005255 [Pseudomonas frederiksbergensis]|uniref:hypothetical protein n=1 Tax=Pseudomonas frederiksbergensis TaxID=104087 RepID=UPI003D1DD041